MKRDYNEIARVIIFTTGFFILWYILIYLMA